MSDQKVDALSLDDDSINGSIKLLSKDGREFSVEKKYAFISNLIKTSMETDPSATELPMPGVKGDVLSKVVEYMMHHKGIDASIPEKPLRSSLMKDVCKDPWDAEFIDRLSEHRQNFYDLILAANYMDIKGLMHLGCAKIAALIKGKPLEKIPEILSKGTKATDEKK